ncbi:MAG: outer membrane lipoprotein-sorting protein [Verrucomicrobia bacterium]|nr:outer membrane lipoprotein-sorting protein [Verrucomicrobiota bacterium]
MNARCVLVILVAAGCGVGLGAGAGDSKPSEIQEGQQLAAQIRATPPAESMTLSGRIQVRDGQSNLKDLPFQFRTTVTASNWITVYRVNRDTTPAPPLLAVIHEPGKPSSYWESDASSPDDWKPLDGKAAGRAFGDSDFSIFDLGLGFFHWPQQRVIKTEMRKSRSCRVLESMNLAPGPKDYKRVLSWVDSETGGLLLAEAYDHQNRLIKEFSVNSMKKINDQWHVQQMEIRNTQTKSRTRLDFDVK